MPTLEQIVEDKLARLESVPDELLSAVDKTNKLIWEKILSELKSLALQDGNFIASVDNIAKVQNIVEELKTVIFDGSEYIQSVVSFVGEISNQNDLTAQIFEGFGTVDATSLAQITEQAQKNTLTLFEESQIEAVWGQPLKNLMINNITSGGSYTDMVQSLQDFILGNDEVDARLSRYIGQITRDTFAMQDRNFTQVVASDMDIKYWKYAGGVLKDSREFCVERHDLIFSDDYIRSWANKDWQGKNANTTESTIFTYLGGYNCIHSLIPVSEEMANNNGFDNLRSVT